MAASDAGNANPHRTTREAARMPPTPARAAFGTLLRDLRNTRHLSQAALGHRLKVTPDAVASWEKGRTLPRTEHAAAFLDRHLHAHGTLLAAWHTAHTDSRPDTGPVGTTPAADARSVLADAARAAAAFGAWAEQLTAGEVAITTLAVQARQLAADALTRPPAQVAAAAADLASETFTALRGHHKPAHTRDLYVVAGSVSALLAWLAGDLGDLDSARLHGSTAALCADHADQPGLHAWVASVRSKTALWSGDYQGAAELAAQGLTHAAQGTVRTMLACQQADAYAMLGALREVRAALQRAETEAATRTGSDAIGGLFSFGPARHANYAASAHLALGEHAAAIADTDRALAEFEVDPGYGFGTIAQVHIARCLTYADAGDLDGAAVALRPVLDLPPERRLATLTGRLKPLAHALGAPALRSSTVAAPLRQELIEFCRTPGPRALGSREES